MDRRPLYEALLDRLHDKINTSDLQPGDRLPSEAEMAVSLGVSRATLREALNVLAQEGFIAKRHGIGTFVTAKAVVTGLETLETYTEIIRRTGHDAQEILLTVRRADPAELDEAALFQVDDGLPVPCIESLRLIDSAPAIFCRDYLNPAQLPTDGLAYAQLHRPDHESLLQFLDDDLGKKPDHADLTITAIAADPLVAEALQVAASTPLLCLTGTAVDEQLVPLYFSRNYFLTDHFQFRIVRRRARQRRG